MKNLIYFALFVFITVLFQLTFVDCFKIFNLKPDFILVNLVIVSLYLDLRRTLILWVFTGLLKDILSANSFGLNTLIFPILGLAFIKLSKEISLDNNFIRMAVVFIISFFYQGIRGLIFFSLGRFNLPLFFFLGIMSLESLYTALILPLVFWLIKPALFLLKTKE